MVSTLLKARDFPGLLLCVLARFDLNRSRLFRMRWISNVETPYRVEPMTSLPAPSETDVGFRL